MCSDDLPKVTDQWVTSRKALSAFGQFCLDQEWVFTELPQQFDFGKDGYLDFSKSGKVSGLCIAVQVKGGASFRRVDGFTVSAKSKHRRLWSQSTIPVFCVVWDPDDELYWINVTDLLKREGIDIPITIPHRNRLDEDGLAAFVAAAQTAAEAAPSMVAFGSTDVELQTAAIWDCYGFGRHNPEYLVLLRRVMFHLEPSALELAVDALDTCSLSLDSFKDPTWMTTEQRAIVRQSYRWTVDEAVALLDGVYDDGNGYFGYASFGRNIYWLIVGPEPYSEHFVRLVEAATRRAISEDRLHAAAMGLTLWLYWLGEQGPAALDEMLRHHPKLAQHDEIAMICDMIAVEGKVVL